MLVPLAASGELLLTVRTESLPSHAGQIAFPGGSLEGGESAEEAALREAQEEVSLPPKIAKPLGRLPAVLSPHGFYVQPVVAWLPDKPALTANPDEVSQILWAPLSELAQSSSWSELRRRGDFERLVWHYPWRDRDVWGLTANVLHELLERCRQARTSGGSR